MAETAFTYAKFFKSLTNKEVNLTADTFKVMLLGNGYTPSQTLHQYKSDLGVNEISGMGYAADGIVLAGMALTWDSINSRWVITTTTTPQWTSATFSAYYGVVYDSSPSTDATRPLLTCIDFGGPKAPSAGNFTIHWPTTGIAYTNVLSPA